MGAGPNKDKKMIKSEKLHKYAKDRVLEGPGVFNYCKCQDKESPENTKGKNLSWSLCMTN